MASLRREIIGDSVYRARLLTKLIALIREDERRKVLDGLDRASARKDQ